MLYVVGVEVVVADNELKVMVGGTDDEQIDNSFCRRWRGRSSCGRLAHSFCFH